MIHTSLFNLLNICKVRSFVKMALYCYKIYMWLKDRFLSFLSLEELYTCSRLSNYEMFIIKLDHKIE